MEVAAREERAQETAAPWWAWPTVRLALLQGASLGLVAVAVFGVRPEGFLCAWVPALLSLFEAWARATSPPVVSGRRVVGLMAAAFVLGSVGFVACWFQVVYVRALFGTRALDAALAAVTSEAARLVEKKDCVIVVFFAELAALAHAVPFGFRLGRPAAAVVGFVAIVAVAPLLDWTILAALTPRSQPRELLQAAGVSSILLGVTALPTTAVVGLLQWGTTRAHRRLFA